ncbi:hypothetical protein [Paraflavitalea pollutisoli]|uniref:hypothetical protein n=1 Tax=Paraflavitalea pollutisoli TaxID=3034143 RepID=UPI0023ED34F0|nr:hypothetical protein [Paraflavitalea sp. H1-2-19X]
MNAAQSAGTIQLLLLLIILTIGALFFWTQHRAFLAVRPENRRMEPGLVWLQFIPLFGLGWQFYVIVKLSDSIRDDLNAPSGDSLFGDDPVPTHTRPTYGLGISYAILICISLLPLGLIKSLFSLAGLVLLIIYWIDVARYTKRLKNRIV